MPRRTRSNQELLTSDEMLDMTLTIRQNGPVKEYLKNNHFDLLKQVGQPLQCPVCMEDVLGCRNCFCLLVCGHALHLHEYLKLSKCPVCRD